MANNSDLIHPGLRKFFREWLAAHRSLGAIDRCFQRADVRCDYKHEPGEPDKRRNLIEQYYHSLDFTTHHESQKFLRVVANILAQLEAELERLRSPYAPFSFFGDRGPSRSVAEVRADISEFRRLLKRYGFSYQDGQISDGAERTTGAALHATVNTLDAPNLHRQVERMNQAIESDPELAIGTAKELIETVCKQILIEQGGELDSNWDVSQLVKETRISLQLVADDQADADRAMRRLLSSLSNIVRALAELRNRYGTGHGPSPQRQVLESRHARLAAGAAETLAHFLLSTYQAWKPADD